MGGVSFESISVFWGSTIYSPSSVFCDAFSYLILSISSSINWLRALNSAAYITFLIFSVTAVLTSFLCYTICNWIDALDFPLAPSASSSFCLRFCSSISFFYSICSDIFLSFASIAANFAEIAFAIIRLAEFLKDSLDFSSTFNASSFREIRRSLC